MERLFYCCGGVDQMFKAQRASHPVFRQQRGVVNKVAGSGRTKRELFRTGGEIVFRGARHRHRPVGRIGRRKH